MAPKPAPVGRRIAEREKALRELEAERRRVQLGAELAGEAKVAA